MRFALILTPLIALGFSAPEARAAKKFKNVQVLNKDLGKHLGKGMKSLTKGLGVKCQHCHVKGKMQLDDVEAKEHTRAFFKVVLTGPAEPGPTEKAALTALLKQIKIEAPKDPKKIWAAFTHWRTEKKAAPAKEKSSK